MSTSEIDRLERLATQPRTLRPVATSFHREGEGGDVLLILRSDQPEFRCPLEHAIKFVEMLREDPGIIGASFRHEPATAAV